MNGSRSQFSRHATGSSSLEALNRTIEGLEARIEGILGRSANPPAPGPQVLGSRSARQSGDPLEDIRARQRALDSAQRGSAAQASSGRQPEPQHTYAAPARSDGRTGSAADAFSALRQEIRADISQTVSQEMAALRREIGALRTEARQQELPQELRRDLAGIAASIDALGGHDSGADSLRLELDSMRTMIDRLAREDSVQSLESRWRTVEDQMSSLDMGGLREELVSLAYRVDDIREVLAAMPASGQVQAIENKIAGLSQTIEMMTRLPAGAGQDFLHQFDMLGARLDEITRAIAAMPAAARPAVDNAPFERLEARLASVAQKIDDLDPAAGASDVGARIESLAARVAQLADEEAVTRLDARIERLQGLIEQSAQDDYLPELSGHLASIADKIDALDVRGADETLAARLDSLARQIDSLSGMGSQPNALPEAAIGRLEALIGRAEATAARAIDPLPGLESLDAKLADIAAKLQQAELTAAGIAMQPVTGLETVEARLADISARLEREPAWMGDTTIPAIENLEIRLADIANRLDMNAGLASGASDEILSGLEDQIANLSRLVSANSPGAGAEALDNRLASFEEHLATSDEFVVEAARQAAEAALSAYAGQMGANASPQSIANIEIITALADDLKALESISRKSEDRTSRAFEAVQDTLLKIADRLERLDLSPAAPRHSSPASRDHAAEADQAPLQPAMPQASTAVIDDAVVSIEADDPGARSGQVMVSGQSGKQGRPAHSPSEAAALAAAYAASQSNDEADSSEMPPSEKSFLSGLAARIRPGKEPAPAAAEPRFSEPNSPPLDPSLELDPAMANMPLEPGSGAPDINRILQKVREAQAAERQRGEGPDHGPQKAEFLASARRAAIAAAAEVETIGNGRKGRGKSGLLEILKSRKRPILMAAGAVLLAVMSFPLISGLLEGDDKDMTAVEPAVIEQAAPVDQPVSIPLAETATDAMAVQQGAAEPRLPEVRVIEPGGDPSAASSPPQLSAAEGANTSMEETAAIGRQAEPPASTEMQTADASGLKAELDALPEGATSPGLKAAAAEGNPLAFYEIGARFTEGRGVPIDLARAAAWYQRAADLGNAPSQYRIANFYEKGSGVVRNLDTAKKWYQMAAEQGNASAMHNLAVLYATAGAAPDFDNAAFWFGRAAEVGVRDSQVNLAILYARGDGVGRDLEQSYKWFAIAANDGDKDAAVKRDEVFNALRPEQVDAAREAVSAWKPQPVDPAANTVDLPAEWVTDDTKTASIDMGKAIRNIQAILNNNGFDAGKPDGIIGARTVSAIKAFQTSVGLEPTGEITDELVKELLEHLR